MRLSAVIIAFVPRLVIAVALFAVIVCAAICTALSRSRVRHSPPIGGRHHEVLLRERLT